MRESKFEKEWQSLINSFENGSFNYKDSSIPISTVVDAHFQTVRQQEKYGVYIVRRQATMEVLYIRKCGTVKQNGGFKGQNIPRRLKNMKGNMRAEEWCRNLFTQKGPLLIDYVFADTQPKSPSLLEAVLLQTFFNEFGYLPNLNKAFSTEGYNPGLSTGPARRLASAILSVVCAKYLLRTCRPV